MEYLTVFQQDFDKEHITKEFISLDSLNLKHSNSSKSSTSPAFVLRNCFTSQECRSLIDLANSEGFTDTLVNIGGKDVVNEDVRSGCRFILDAPELVNILWDRIRQHVPQTLKGASVVGLNERLRFLRYGPGQKFAPHYDGTFAREYNSMEVSLLTLQIYLNDDFVGGETNFLGDDKSDDADVAYCQPEKVNVVPETGMMSVFEQNLMHEGAEITSGVKYTVRTDVMYSYSTKYC